MCATPTRAVCAVGRVNGGASTRGATVRENCDRQFLNLFFLRFDQENLNLSSVELAARGDVVQGTVSPHVPAARLRPPRTRIARGAALRHASAHLACGVRRGRLGLSAPLHFPRAASAVQRLSRAARGRAGAGIRSKGSLLRMWLAGAPPPPHACGFPRRGRTDPRPTCGGAVVQVAQGAARLAYQSLRHAGWSGEASLTCILLC